MGPQERWDRPSSCVGIQPGIETAMKARDNSQTECAINEVVGRVLRLSSRVESLRNRLVGHSSEDRPSESPRPPAACLADLIYTAMNDIDRAALSAESDIDAIEKRLLS